MAAEEMRPPTPTKGENKCWPALPVITRDWLLKHHPTDHASAGLDSCIDITFRDRRSPATNVLRHTSVNGRTRATIDLLKDTFGDHLISRFGPVNWPPRSYDLTPLDYFLWGYVKSLVYADKPQTLDHLEDNIRRVIADIRPQMLEKVIENWTSRLDYIRASRGSPMPEIIFKMKSLKCASNYSLKSHNTTVGDEDGIYWRFFWIRHCLKTAQGKGNFSLSLIGRNHGTANCRLTRQNQDLIRALQIIDDSHSHKVTVQFDKFDEENENFDSFIEKIRNLLRCTECPIANRAKVFVSSLSGTPVTKEFACT
ncbi:putative LOC100569746 [Trichonephila clavipes]|nr:putative LOC100569746 [Trichonephila clavipes]